MGKHTRGAASGGSGGDERRHKRTDAARRVPAERRRTPGERNTARQTQRADTGYRLTDPATRRSGSLESAPERLRVERDRRRAKRRRVAAIVAVVIGVVLLGAVGSAFAYFKRVESTMQPRTVVDQKQLDVELTPAKPLEPFNILLLGADYRPGETQYRTDTIILAHINPQKKQIWLLSIPRDTKVAIPGHGESKINNAHYFGGAPLAVKTVKQFTGLPVNYYMEVKFKAFQRVVDELGGVWVKVPKAINDPKADRSPHHRAAKIPAGYQKLDGEHALTFVRSRDYADADWSRMKSQQIFFKALADQLAKTTNVAKLPSVVNAVAPNIVTNLRLVDMIKITMALRDAGSDNVFTATVPGTWKSPYIYPDRVGMKKQIAAIKNERSFDGTKTVTPTATVDAQSIEAVPATTKKPSQITVIVRNGSGVTGRAKQAASVLKTQGFKIAETGNSNQSVYKQTLIVYKTDAGPAKLLASYLPPASKVVQSRGMYAFTSDLLVVVGKDWDVNDIPAAPIVDQ